jgi:hypothetical protein
MYYSPRIPPGGILDPPGGDGDVPLRGMGILPHICSGPPSLASPQRPGASPLRASGRLFPLSVATG